jgi:transcriptional regulator with XRE-family HTH domain
MTIATGIPQFTRGDRLRKAREIMGLDRSQFADLIGIHRDSVARYEKGTKVRPIVLRAWSEVTGVDRAWLEHGDEAPSDYKSDVSAPKISRKAGIRPRGRKDQRASPARTLGR